MGAMKQHPRYNVVSMRISDEEKELLLLITRTTRKSVSAIMREVLCHLKQGRGDYPAKYEQTVMEARRLAVHISPLAGGERIG